MCCRRKDQKPIIRDNSEIHSNIDSKKEHIRRVIFAAFAVTVQTNLLYLKMKY